MSNQGLQFKCGDYNTMEKKSEHSCENDQAQISKTGAVLQNYSTTVFDTCAPYSDLQH